MRRGVKWSLRVVALAMASAGGLFAWFIWWPLHTVPALEHVDEYVWLDQGWGAGQDAELRQLFYYTPQGTSLPQGASAGALRYNWFVNLEIPWSSERFAAPDHLRRYRFVVDPAPSPANPDQLPVGFTHHFDARIGAQVLDISCAACHTSELHFTRDGRTRAIRIDGGPAMHAFADMSPGNFAPELLAALMNTAWNPWKFERFARKVLGPGYPAASPQLKRALHDTIFAMLGSGQNNPLRGLYPVHEGFGRTDALGRLGNTAFGDHLDSSNYQRTRAPVSYPYLWNTWKFDRVQYNGSVAQPLARNMGEAMGVGAFAPLLAGSSEPLPRVERFRSSINFPGMQRIEHALQRLQPPRWPEDVFGPIDHPRAARGAALFRDRCEECHGPHVSERARQQAKAPLKPSNDLEWRIEVIPLEHIGTDPNAALGFIQRRYDLSKTGLGNADLADALRPLLVRDLARDVRFRLREVARVREGEAGKGPLSATAASWPDPDADATPSLPQSAFRALDALLVKSVIPLPDVEDAAHRPGDDFPCNDSCQLQNLLWDLRHGARQIEARLARLDVKALSEGVALNLVGILIKNRFYADNHVDYATQQCLEGFGALDLPQEIAGYKPRPLEGVWATAPFLHNGSVPTLYQMLLPPAKRDRRFFVGRRDFDPVHVGFETQPDADGDDDGFWLDTSIPGNHNTGHAFAADSQTWQKHRADPQANPLPPGVIGPEFTDAERYDLIEYLKVHRDLPATPADWEPTLCRLDGEWL